jgi:hypothetical protein
MMLLITVITVNIFQKEKICIRNSISLQLQFVSSKNSVKQVSHSILIRFQEDPLHHGYHRVNTADSQLSPSGTSTSLDTILIDTSTDPLTAPQPLTLPSSPQRTFNPIRESEGTNPFTKDVNKNDNVKQSKQSLKGSRVSFGQQEEDTFDEDDDTNFKKRREHFQKNKSASTGHKSILIRVSLV